MHFDRVGELIIWTLEIYLFTLGEITGIDEGVNLASLKKW